MVSTQTAEDWSVHGAARVGLCGGGTTAPSSEGRNKMRTLGAMIVDY